MIANHSSEMDSSIAIDSSADDVEPSSPVTAEFAGSPIRCNPRSNVPYSKMASDACNTVTDSLTAHALARIPGTGALGKDVECKVSVRCDSLKRPYLEAGQSEDHSFNGKQLAHPFRHPQYPDPQYAPDSPHAGSPSSPGLLRTSRSYSKKRISRGVITILDDDEPSKKMKSSPAPTKPHHLDPSFSSQSYLIKLLCYRYSLYHSSSNPHPMPTINKIRNKIKAKKLTKQEEDFISMPWYARQNGLARTICHLKPKDFGTFSTSVIYIYIYNVIQ